MVRSLIRFAANNGNDNDGNDGNENDSNDNDGDGDDNNDDDDDEEDFALGGENGKNAENILSNTIQKLYIFSIFRSSPFVFTILHDLNFESVHRSKLILLGSHSGCCLDLVLATFTFRVR